MTLITIQGNLGRDSVERDTEKGGKFLSFTVCSNDFIGGKQKEQWFDCTWFNYNANMVQYLKKGSNVIVSGSLDADLEVGADGNTYIRRRVNVHYVTFASNGKKDENSQTPQNVGQTEQVKKATTTSAVTPPSDEEVSVGNLPNKKVVKENVNNSDLPF